MARLGRLGPAARPGLHCYRSGVGRFVSRLGVDNAKLLFLIARRLDAQAMRRIGYLTQLVAPEAFEAEVGALSRDCASMAPLALLGMKRHL